jgi:hypothetical protein
MKLFIVAVFLLVSVTNGFQPLVATKMATFPSAMKETPGKKTVPKTPVAPGKKVVPVAPTKKVVPVAPPKKK